MKNIYLVLVSLAAAVLVAGCGGSSSGAAATPVAAKVSITATNAGSVAKGGMSPSQTAAKTGSGGAGTVGVVVQPSPPKKSALQVALSQLRLMESKQFPVAPAGVVGVSVSPYFPVQVGCGPYSTTMTFTTPIPGIPASAIPAFNPASGVLAIDFIDNTVPPNGKFDSGDTASITATNCIDTNPAIAGATTTMNGNMSMTVTAQSGGVLDPLGTGKMVGAASSPLVETVTMSFTGFSAADFYPATASAVAATETITLSGGFTMAITDDGTVLTTTMTGTALTMTSTTDGTFSMKNFTIVETEDSPSLAAASLTGNYSFNVKMTTNIATLGGEVDITTPTTFRGTGNNEPTVGVMVITGAGGSTLTLTANAAAPGAPAGTAGPVNEVVDTDGSNGPAAPQPQPDTNWVAI